MSDSPALIPLSDSSLTLTVPLPEKKERVGRLTRPQAYADKKPNWNARREDMLAIAYELRAVTALQMYLLVRLRSLQRGEEGYRDGVPTSSFQQTLRDLYRYGMLERFALRSTFIGKGTVPLVYRLTARGAEKHAEHRGIHPEELGWFENENEVKPNTVEHFIDTTTFRIAVLYAAYHHGGEVLEWREERQLKRETQSQKGTVSWENARGDTETARIIPDAYVEVKVAGQRSGHFFIEIDRKTQTLKDMSRNTAARGPKHSRTFARKIRTYLEYYRQGNYQARFGSSDLRILYVTLSKDRCQRMKRVAEKVLTAAQATVKDTHRFLFTTLASASSVAALTAPIWHIAGRDGLHSLFKVNPRK